MSTIVSIHDRATIAELLRRNAALHLYALGDLDPFFWPRTLWYGLEVDGVLQQVVMGYLADELLVLHALSPHPIDEMRELLQGIMYLLPPHIYAHLSPGLLPVFAPHYRVTKHSTHHKMLLVQPAHLQTIDTTGVICLSGDDCMEIEALYAASYPGNWFDPRMLATGHYYGLRVDEALVSVAGVHVYAPAERVAALSNIVTHPEARGRGYATRVTARLCLELLQTIDQIGLNVLATNATAISCYQRLGFVQVASYEEVELHPLV